MSILNLTATRGKDKSLSHLTARVTDVSQYRYSDGTYFDIRKTVNKRYLYRLRNVSSQFVDLDRIRANNKGTKVTFVEGEGIYTSKILYNFNGMFKAESNSSVSSQILSEIYQWYVKNAIEASGLGLYNNQMPDWDTPYKYNVFEKATKITKTDIDELVNSVENVDRVIHSEPERNNVMKRWRYSNGYYFYRDTHENSFQYYYPISGEISDFVIYQVIHKFGGLSNATFHKGSQGIGRGFYTKTEITSFDELFMNTSVNDPMIAEWYTGNITSMRGMFKNNFVFNQNIGIFWEVQNVEDMSYMFYNAYSFNQDIKFWKVNDSINMSHMFYNAISFNKKLTTPEYPCWYFSIDEPENFATNSFLVIETDNNPDTSLKPVWNFDELLEQQKYVAPMNPYDYYNRKPLRQHNPESINE